MENKAVPDKLYAYTLYTTCGAFNVCSEVSTADSMWKLIESAKATKSKGKMPDLWTLRKNGTFERIYVDASIIGVMSDKASDAPPIKPNVAQQRRDRGVPATSAIARNSHPSRVTIGQTAKKPTGQKR